MTRLIPKLPVFSLPLGLLGVALLGALWNLPVFSWVSDYLENNDNNKLTTLVRLSPRAYDMCKYHSLIRVAPTSYEAEICLGMHTLQAKGTHVLVNCFVFSFLLLLCINLRTDSAFV